MKYTIRLLMEQLTKIKTITLLNIDIRGFSKIAKRYRASEKRGLVWGTGFHLHGCPESPVRIFEDAEGDPDH